MAALLYWTVTENLIKQRNFSWPLRYHQLKRNKRAGMLNAQRNGNNEIRMIWLMALIIAGVGCWFSDLKIFSYLCGFAFAVSVMHYVDDLQKPTDQLSAEAGLSLVPTSKIPLYISSIMVLVGGFSHIGVLTGVGISAWIYFFLRWLKRLERNVLSLQRQLHTRPDLNRQADLHSSGELSQPERPMASDGSMNLIDQLQQWLFKGNPVLKAAIAVLVIGVILLLRFATEHWQISLAVKLLLVAAVSAGVTLLGYVLEQRNRGFALALEGLGLASLSLTLFFAYYNQVIPNLLIASLCFAAILLPAIWLSLKQQSIELALMAMMIAYIAPFTLPVRNATAAELIAYYLCINLAVAVLSTLRPWKILNQISFLMTVLVGGAYAFYRGEAQERTALSYLIYAHAAIFIWLGFRFSQLLAKENLMRFQLKPVLDLALIFGAPIVSYGFLYLMYFDEKRWQAGFSLIFAGIYGVLYLLSKRNQAIRIISQSYFSLMLIFIAFIPPILLHEHWSVAGWAGEGAAIFIYALYRHSVLSRYVGIGLMMMAGFSSLYYFSVLNIFPSNVYWVLCACYLLTVLIANSTAEFRRQLTSSTIAFQCIQMLSATVLLFILLLDKIDSQSQVLLCLLIVAAVYMILNEWLLRREATWSWLLPKWIGLIPVYGAALYAVADLTHNGQMIWHTVSDRLLFALSGILLTLLWLRPMLGVKEEKEWVSLGVFVSLAFTSLTLIPSMPYLSVVILPLLFAAWCYWRSDSDWQIFWQARNTLTLMLLWIIFSQIFSQQAFQLYLLPVLNPFDLISIAMLAGFIWMLNLQMKAGLEKSLGAILMMLGLLWLSSYVVLRALHVYLGTPYNAWQMWGNAAVQLSFTLLWVSLAFICMLTAAKRHLRSLWIFGGSILVLVTLKLVLFDLSHIGTLTRVISFLGAGFIMLIIAYIAPMPEAQKR
ncbi:DUF2339 domain-containing protein [Acinetobacter pragensis]